MLTLSLQREKTEATSLTASTILSSKAQLMVKKAENNPKKSPNKMEDNPLEGTLTTTPKHQQLHQHGDKPQ
ncbi:hypothetical protein Sjap_015721 [Stephania japonica]|uniref:Uncharacterized protein n=1 Tax=Stephania japonica TaxID=461633 RepID=A0AAP0IJN6_9MAGN